MVYTLDIEKCVPLVVLTSISKIGIKKLLKKKSINILPPPPTSKQKKCIFGIISRGPNMAQKIRKIRGIRDN